jgi:hypothetical protein
MRNRLLEFLTRLIVCMFLLLIVGCASSGNQQPPQPLIQPPPLFPPQSVIQSGDYAGFFAENDNVLKNCKEPEQCTVALFNIAFLHCYSKSPYYNPSKGMLYLSDLIKGSPDSPWAYQAQVWIDIIKKNAKKEPKKKLVKEDAKSKDNATFETNTLVETVDIPQDNAWEADRQRLESEVKSKEETIRELKGQIERSRQIDLEIEKKERGLLY